MKEVLLARRDKIHEYVEEDLDLSGLATAEQGSKADTAIQPAALAAAEVTTESDTRTLAEWAGAVRRRVMYVDSIDDLLSLNVIPLADGQQALVGGYYAGSSSGGGVFSWREASTDPDNGGTVFEVSDVAVGRWIRPMSHVTTPYDFGAKGDGVQDDIDYLDAWIANDSRKDFAPGKYRITRTLRLAKRNLKLVGHGKETEVYGDGVTGAVVSTVSTDNTEWIANGICISDFNVTGSGESAFALSNLIGSSADRLCCDGFAGTYGYVFESGWANRFSNLYSNGGNISEANFVIGRCCLDVIFDLLYTSTFANYNILLDADLRIYSGDSASGNGRLQFNMPTLQGANKYGMWIKKYSSVQINRIYAENVQATLRIGSGSNTISEIEINNCEFFSRDEGHTVYIGDNESTTNGPQNIVFNTCRFYNSDIVLGSTYGYTVFNDCVVSGSVDPMQLLSCLKRNAHWSSEAKARITAGQTICMSTTGFAWSMRRMEINGSGEWVSTAYTPTEISYGPHID